MYEEGSDAKHKSGAGRPTQKLPPKQARCLVDESTGRVGVSARKLASKYGISRYPRSKNPGQEWCYVARAAAGDLIRNFFS